MRSVPLGTRGGYQDGKLKRRPDLAAGQCSPQNTERSSSEDGSGWGNPETSIASGSDQVEADDASPLGSEHISVKKKKTGKRVRFQLPEEGQYKHSGWGTGKKMNRMWSTWKKRRQPSAVYALKAERAPRQIIHSCQVPVKLNGVALTILVDTEASKSFIDLATWRRIADLQAKLSAADAALHGANGQPLRVYGTVDQTFELNKWKYNQRF